MIVYFADRQLNILGHASTNLRGGLTITYDLKTADVETGVSVFELKIPFDKSTRKMVESYTEVGNYILRNHETENELYQIIDAEIDTKKQVVYIYAEDDGMDLLNEVVGVYEADQAYPISHYINKYAAGAGFEIGINEAGNLTRKLSWDGESTASARIASIATQFDGCEVSYSFEVDGLFVVKKYINIYKKRGRDVGVQLRLNKEIESILIAKSIGNLATALQCTGGTPEDDNIEDDVEPTAITLQGYSYDDGDFYVDGTILKSRKALERWSRVLWKTEESQRQGGHIVKQFYYDTVSQKTLCAHAITELKKIREMEVNYKAEVHDLCGATIGDRLYIVDDAGELYLSTRILQLEISVTEQEIKAIFGEYLIKGSGIHQKVLDLADQFAKNSVSVARATAIANTAKSTANEANQKAESVAGQVEEAAQAAQEATTAANVAAQSAQAAQEAADIATGKVEAAEQMVESIEGSVATAQQAAQEAEAAAEIAQGKSVEAETAAQHAAANAVGAAQNAAAAMERADAATATANTAISTANDAKFVAQGASDIAESAKADAEQAEKDISDLSNRLETVSRTMEADYTRKTEFTETTANLQSQISQNAGLLSSTVSLFSVIDETANEGATMAERAQKRAQEAKKQANQATAEAESAQDAADAAKQEATAAQAEADTAQAAAETAQSVADQAEANLTAAIADLETVSSRADATEEEIATAQQAVEAAQTAANTAHAEAEEATERAAEAQEIADEAIKAAEEAQATADTAAKYAKLAQSVANEAEEAATAQTIANEAAQAAEQAQGKADSAYATASEAKEEAEKAAQEAAQAVADAEAADAQAVQAAADLVAAKQRLDAVLADVDATEEEIEAAQADVETAQSAADAAMEKATEAAAYAAQAAIDAANAQAVADKAKAAADEAQTAADEAQAAANKAQEDVNGLAIRVTSAETNIRQNAEQIELRAKKTEVAETLGGYYTKKETDAAIKLESDAIKSTVSSIKVGGRNLALGTKTPVTITGTGVNNQCQDIYQTSVNFIDLAEEEITVSFDYEYSEDTDVDSLTRANIRPPADPFTIIANFLPTDSLSGHYSGVAKIYTTQTSVSKISTRFDYFTGSVTISNLKIERGNKATDWTPAPEDVDADISDASDLAASAEENATNATERITEAESTIQQLANNIKMLVVDENGESLMEQTSSGWTFSTSAIQGQVDAASELLSRLVEQMGSAEAAIDMLSNSVDEFGVIAEFIHTGSYTYTDENGVEQTEPSIDLFETDTGFKLKITNTRIMFTDGANALVTIDSKNKSLTTPKATIESELQIGGESRTDGVWIWKQRANGNLGLMWKGVSS